MIKDIDILKNKTKIVKIFIVIFYIVGIAGFIIPFTNPLFRTLTPFALVGNFILLFYFHQKNQLWKDILLFSIIFLGGLVIEMVGVQTKVIFGDYTYGNGLGFKVYDTPLIIGLNWLFLSYTTSSVVNKAKINNLFKVIIASLIMLAYDLILEQVAPEMNMWSWKDDIIPLQNYAVWFLLALIFNTMTKIFKINTKNQVAFLILASQSVFFLVLLIYFKLFI